MTNWIDSGGDQPRLYGRRLDNVRCKAKRWRIGSATRWRGALQLSCAVLMLALATPYGQARDDGRYANSPLKEWFDSLRSGKGPCCSDADGSAISDSDWESKDGRYRVRVPRYGYLLDGQQQELVWVDVPDDAVISEPNRVGRTMVWPIYGYMGVAIRCFMPGSMT
ncbi:hypothetical protein [Bradyrhizobium liaoningense]|uniref:hypothetical protein n=1 Tax=Bradyrhizobium liaoningense TaxID=43992 RepID=UPI001BA5DD76|nr:hypothetical protein [Bradyrhizobium liaoningense]MBR0716034.1 hypothetical protein [Bradyrhizobium liaoningense]